MGGCEHAIPSGDVAQGDTCSMGVAEEREGGGGSEHLHDRTQNGLHLLLLLANIRDLLEERSNHGGVLSKLKYDFPGGRVRCGKKMHEQHEKFEKGGNNFVLKHHQDRGG